MDWKTPVATTTTTAKKATDDTLSVSLMGSRGGVSPGDFGTTKVASKARPPSQRADAARWKKSRASPRPGLPPVDAWPASPGVRRRPILRTPTEGTTQDQRRDPRPI